MSAVLATVSRLHLKASALEADEIVEVPAGELIDIINCFWKAQQKTSVQDTRIDRAVDFLLAARAPRRHNCGR